MSPRIICAISVSLTLLLSTAAQAGSVTAESIWSSGNARTRAIRQMPRGAEVIRTRCREFEVGIGNFRYRCTVDYEESPDENPNVPSTPAGSPEGTL